MSILLSASPYEEWRIQQSMTGAMTKRFQPAFEAEIAKASRDMLNTYTLTGSVPALPMQHVRGVETVFRELTTVAVDAFGGRMLGKAHGSLETKVFSELFERLAAEYLQAEAIRRRITYISEATRAMIISAIAKEQLAGSGVDKIAQIISDAIPGISRYRGALIARTETHGASQYANHKSAKATGLDLVKVWVSVKDHRTRDFGESDGVIDEFSHRAMDGVEANPDDPFMVPRSNKTFEPLMFPGDPEGSPGSVINCRCAVVHKIRGT